MSQNGRTLRVMIVDDERDAADSLGLLIRLWGFETRVAYDHSALNMTEDFRPDVILLDIGLPRMDGNEITRQLRQRPSTKDALIIAVTGFHDEANRLLSEEAGIDRYMIKPLDPDELERLLRATHAMLQSG
jgi:two-component system, OmpR family, response regulator